MINIRSVRKLQNNDGLTLKKGHIITYKSGWQVATEGIETTDPREAINAVKAYGGDCGVWYSEGGFITSINPGVSAQSARQWPSGGLVISSQSFAGAQWG